MHVRTLGRPSAVTVARVNSALLPPIFSRCEVKRGFQGAVRMGVCGCVVVLDMVRVSCRRRRDARVNGDGEGVVLCWELGRDVRSSVLAI